MLQPNKKKMNAPRSDDAGGREVVIAVLGMTGTGKSTLIRQLSGPNMGINYGGLDAGKDL
jgi:ABC-type hemin transport system ATPase subunit